jgi:hypothetical protein
VIKFLTLQNVIEAQEKAPKFSKVQENTQKGVAPVKKCILNVPNAIVQNLAHQK